MSIDIVSNRIPATPRSKYHKYMTASNVVTQNANNGSGSIDTSNFVVKTGETEQTVEGSFGAMQDIVAFKTSYSYFDSYLPIASSYALGCVKVGAYLTIDEDGTLNAERGGGASNWDELKGKPATLDNTNWEYAYTNAHKHAYLDALNGITPTDIAYWNSAVSYMHTHNNLAYLDTVDQNLSKTSDVNFNSVKADNDIVAFSTGISTDKFPIASTTALGCIKVGENLTIEEDGTLNAEAGGGAANWDELQGKPAGLTSENITKWNTAATNSHTHSNKSTLDNISSSDINSWDNAASNSHYHNNKTTLDNISSSDISNWDSAVNYSHSHNNKSYLDNINQYLSKSSTPTFSGGLVTGDTSGLNIKHSSGNAINGCNKSNIANLYFNYTDAYQNVLVDADCNLRAYGDVVAFKTGTSSSPFKYWYPSVSSSGNLSWTNSTSTSTPSTVNIKGPKGDKGDTGKSIGKVSAYSTSTASSGKSTYYVYDTSNTHIGSFNVYNGAKGEKGDTGPRGPQGPQGPKGADGSSRDTWPNIYLKNTDWPCVVFKANRASTTVYLHHRKDGPLYIAFGSIDNNKHSFSPNGDAYIPGTLNCGTVTCRNVSCSGTVTYGSLVKGSDIRLKNRLEDVNNVLENIESIQTFKYTFKNDSSNDVNIGVSAQDLIKVYPELVKTTHTDEDGTEFYGVNYAELSVIALQGLKELHALVKDQKSQIDLLKQEIAELKNTISNK